VHHSDLQTSRPKFELRYKQIKVNVKLVATYIGYRWWESIGSKFHSYYFNKSLYRFVFVPKLLLIALITFKADASSDPDALDDSKFLIE